jgi:hypothetical protein
MFSQRGWESYVPETEQFKSHDLLVSCGSDKYLIEVERKKVWKKSGEWEGWDTVDIPQRKSESKSDYFIMLNEPLDTMLIIHMCKVLSSKVIKKDTIYTKQEPFFRVPLEEFTIMTKQDGVWR